jgi:hypothetical protein
MTNLYLGNDIASASWTDAYARRFLSPILAEGTRKFVQNIACQVGVAQTDGVVLPFTVTEFLPNNSYVCSPFNHYVTYAREELRNLGNRVVEALLGMVIQGLGQVLNPRSFDRVVMVNNWLLSTNLYPQIQGDVVVRTAQALVEQFPNHAILFRSLDHFRNPHLITALTTIGCQPVFSRQVWYQDARTAAVQQSRDFKNDVRLLKRTPYKVVPVEGELSDAEIERVVDLYNLLYLEKYSRHNPQFTPRWVRLMMSERLMHFALLVRDGRIDGVYGYFARNGVMAQPFLGYDTTLPQETGLYRLLSAMILLEAGRTGNLCHASSGVGKFKKLRGGIGAEEYNLVYLRHLPPARQRAWALIQWVLDKVAVPIIQKGGY